MIDCKALREDIKEMRHATEEFGRKVMAVRENGEGMIEASDYNGAAGSLEDMLLQKYLGEFAERNPEVFGVDLTMGERVSGIEKPVLTATQIKDGKALVSVADGGVYIYDRKSGSMEQLEDSQTFPEALRFCRLSDDNVVVCAGANAPGWHIDLTNDKLQILKAGNFSRAARVSDKEVLVHEETSGLFKIFDINSQEVTWELSQPYGVVDSMTPISDHQILIGAATDNLIFDTEKREITDSFDFSTEAGLNGVGAAELLGDGKALVGGIYGGLVVLDLESPEHETENITLSNPYCNFSYLTKVSDDKVLMVATSDSLMTYDIETGAVEDFGQQIDGWLNFMTPVVGGELLVGGEGSDRRGELRTIKIEMREPSIERLRARLNRIAKKGDI